MAGLRTRCLRQLEAFRNCLKRSVPQGPSGRSLSLAVLESRRRRDSPQAGLVALSTWI
jgi:hypothetical protein